MIARDCGRAGYVVVSGLARGIDTAAHRASLDTGTIAAMAGGLDQPYPPENAGLLEEIMEWATACRQRDAVRLGAASPRFPRRNRLIAGVSLGTVVVEAATRSGSLITARLAGEFGRLVFAVPGSPLDPRCHGTNGLLKDGAMIVTAPDDVIGALAPLSQLDMFSAPLAEEPEQHNGSALLPPDETDRASIVDALGPTPVEIDDIIRHTGLGASAVYLVLLELDIAGRLHRHPGGLVSIAMDV
jgi:DNA processing protein